MSTIINKPLKETTIEKALDKNVRSSVLLNHKKNTAIKIPTSVLNAIKKVNSSIEHADILSHAIQLRSKANDHDLIQNWIEVSHNQSDYPLTPSNKLFSKFLRSVFLSNKIPSPVSEKEIRDIIDFFAKCPHDYVIPEGLIKSHVEIQVETT